MSNNDERLIGIWRVVSLVDSLSNGGVFYPFGENPLGGLLYTPDGFMVLQLAKEERPTFANGYQEATLEEMKKALEACAAMYGRYSVDEQENVVTHQILGSNWPEMIGSTQVRPFELSGDTLTLKPPPFERDGVTHTRRLVLEKLQPSQ